MFPLFFVLLLPIPSLHWPPPTEPALQTVVKPALTFQPTESISDRLDRQQFTVIENAAIAPSKFLEEDDHGPYCEFSVCFQCIRRNEWPRVDAGGVPRRSLYREQIANAERLCDIDVVIMSTWVGRSSFLSSAIP